MTALLSVLFSAGTAAATYYFTKQQLDASARQLDLDESGQQVDRFQRAVDQLSAASIDAQVGGVLALKQLMSDRPSYQPNVMVVLVSFVRRKAPRTKTRRSCSKRLYEAARIKPDPAVQAAVRALADRDPVRDDVLHDASMDLGNIDLRGADLGGAKLSGAFLRNTDLAFANLYKAQFGDADVNGVVLCWANLNGADMLNVRSLTPVSLKCINSRSGLSLPPGAVIPPLAKDC